MQPAIRVSCPVENDHILDSDERSDQINHATSGLRRWIGDALDWLDRYWDDPELRTGFWRSGW